MQNGDKKCSKARSPRRRKYQSSTHVHTPFPCSVLTTKHVFVHFFRNEKSKIRLHSHFPIWSCHLRLPRIWKVSESTQLVFSAHFVGGGARPCFNPGMRNEKFRAEKYYTPFLLAQHPWVQLDSQGERWRKVDYLSRHGLNVGVVSHFPPFYNTNVQVACSSTVFLNLILSTFSDSSDMISKLNRRKNTI